MLRAGEIVCLHQESSHQLVIQYEIVRSENIHKVTYRPNRLYLYSSEYT